MSNSYWFTVFRFLDRKSMIIIIYKKCKYLIGKNINMNELHKNSRWMSLYIKDVTNNNTTPGDDARRKNKRTRIQNIFDGNKIICKTIELYGSSMLIILEMKSVVNVYSYIIFDIYTTSICQIPDLYIIILIPTRMSTRSHIHIIWW